MLGQFGLKTFKRFLNRTRNAAVERSIKFLFNSINGLRLVDCMYAFRVYFRQDTVSKGADITRFPFEIPVVLEDRLCQLELSVGTFQLLFKEEKKTRKILLPHSTSAA